MRTALRAALLLAALAALSPAQAMADHGHATAMLAEALYGLAA